MQPQLRLAYVTTHYPALSHTFILREVDALRRLGAEVQTISLRRTSGEHLLSAENREAATSTFAVRPPPVRAVLAAHLGALLRHPRAYVATLRDAIGMARAGVRSHLWQLFYFAEAIVVWRHCRAHEVRHIHAHHGSAPADVALLVARFGRAARRGPSSWSMTLHGPDELRDVSRFALAEKVQRADAVACISEFARSQLMALVADSQWQKLCVVHCGLRSSEFEHAPSAPSAPSRPLTRPGPGEAPEFSERAAGTSLSGPARLGPGVATCTQVPDRATGAAQVLCVGRLVPVKGHAVLLRALAALVREGHELEAVLVGSGPMRARLEQLVGELGLDGRVRFRGALAQAEVRRCYAEASVFCSPSFAEGVPVVLMEAMASGCPVVATAIAGVRELVRDGDTGLLIAPGSVEELRGALAALTTEPSLRARLAENGAAHVSREYDVDRSAARLMAMFGAPAIPAQEPAPASTADGGHPSMGTNCEAPSQSAFEVHSPGRELSPARTVARDRPQPALHRP